MMSEELILSQWREDLNQLSLRLKITMFKRFFISVSIPLLKIVSILHMPLSMREVTSKKVLSSKIPYWKSKQNREILISALLHFIRITKDNLSK
jgi:hypothetical protein